ncbi:hypothetical protein DM01DRAFT_1155084 [Hesseltinella vesiculosa]|uniref:Uncharacterized protein n=1 Tax=Hesseltinella vesiculosa TaxID=101127 RepID=A0A1X2G661_9FUNG|nr:hypothetical protein DM01DRAFT_1155084 [Hesseltinella vesiculosa]
MESNTLAASHLESWYNAHVWRFIDSAFDDLENIEVIRGESTRRASVERKNNDRLNTKCRQKLGRRLDLVIRTKHVEHAKDVEYGGGECGKPSEIML